MQSLKTEFLGFNQALFILNFKIPYLFIFSCIRNFNDVSVPFLQVAVKFVSKKMQKKEQVAHEADVLVHVQNHQLVALLDTYESPSSLMLVLEL